MTTKKRQAGVLLHPSSLPGPAWIGDLGPSATRFLDWAAEAGFQVWQMLPVSPPGAGNSPYSSPSAFAGSRLLISPERLRRAGWLGSGRRRPPTRDGLRTDYARARRARANQLPRAWRHFREESSAAEREALEEYSADPRHRPWLADWTLFHALRSRFRGRSWSRWPAPLARREPDAIERARRELREEVERERFVQFCFDRQWSRLRGAARARGVELLGDAPYYVAGDGADVWAHRELFAVDDLGRPLRVGGVPPDYFSRTGQLWGNPVYRWDRMAEDGYAWWIDRLRSNFERFDRLRLDHFRGFAGYWEIHAGAETAEDGHWAPGPGLALFRALGRALGALPVLAEDLGTITPDVEELRDELELPGMRILQFDLEDDERPEPIPERAVVYTGTHDNNTTRGWLEELNPQHRRAVLQRTGAAGVDSAVRAIIERAYASPAELCVVPLQDLLELGVEARMNFPGSTRGNWEWRLAPDTLTLALANRLRSLAEEHGRA